MFYCAVHTVRWGADVARTSKVSFHETHDAACRQAESSLPVGCGVSEVAGSFAQKGRYLHVEVRIGRVVPGQGFTLEESEPYYR